MEGIAPPKKNGICVVGEGLNTGTLMVVPSDLSPESHNPVSPYLTLVYSILSPLEPGMRSYKQNFVH